MPSHTNDPNIQVPEWPQRFRKLPHLSFDRSLGTGEVDWWCREFADRGNLQPADLVDLLFRDMPSEPRFICRTLDTGRRQFNIHAESSFDRLPRWSGCVVVDLRDEALIWDELSSSQRGFRLGRRMARNILDVATRLRMRLMRISAERVGSYLWAEAGFIPEHGVWLDLRPGLRNRLRHLGEISHRSAGILERILRCRDADADPGDIRIVASLDDLVESRFQDLVRRDAEPAKARLGKELLINLHWRGALDLGNPQHRRRLEEWLDMPVP